MDEWPAPGVLQLETGGPKEDFASARPMPLLVL